MDKTNEFYKAPVNYIKTFLKWLLLAGITGIIGGMAGTFFHKCLDFATELRIHNSYIMYFLPVGVIIITLMYTKFCNGGNLNTNLIITSVRKEEKIPFIIVPFIFLGTVITQLLGGSVGREGAALQMGGGIGYNLGKIFKLNKNDIHLITMAGMSSVFSALFCTPVTAAVFSLEVISVGAFNFTGLWPCILASVTAFYISSSFGISKAAVGDLAIENISLPLIFKVTLLSICLALISILFCLAIKKCREFMKKWFKNPYLRGVAGATALILLTVVSGTYDYNGAGMNIVERALSGEARVYDFIMKIVFTAITIAAGFKGGEIVPAFFVGATFGCVVGPLFGINAAFAAAIGMIAVFCGVVNCPLASIILSVELFGAGGIALFGIACAVSYIMSGNFGLYKSQNIIYSKITADAVSD